MAVHRECLVFVQYGLDLGVSKTKKALYFGGVMVRLCFYRWSMNIQYLVCVT